MSADLFCERLLRAGLRQDGVFVGERDHLGDPLPEFIGARGGDLADLVAVPVCLSDNGRSVDVAEGRPR